MNRWRSCNARGVLSTTPWHGSDASDGEAQMCSEPWDEGRDSWEVGCEPWDKGRESKVEDVER